MCVAGVPRHPSRPATGGTHVEDEAVGLALEERRLDNHPADGVIPGLHFDFQRSVSLDGGITVGIAEIGRFQEQRRRGVRQFQGKIPVHISHSADKQGTVGRLQQMEMRSGQGAAVGGIEHVSGDGRGLRLCGRRQQEQVQQRRKKQETDPVPPPFGNRNNLFMIHICFYVWIAYGRSGIRCRPVRPGGLPPPAEPKAGCPERSPPYFARAFQTASVQRTERTAAPIQNHVTTEKSYNAASAAPALLPCWIRMPLNRSCTAAPT